MSTNSTIDPQTLPGTKVVGTGGAKLGEVSGVYLDNETAKPEWAAVTSGLFGTHVSLVPLAHAEYDGTELTVPYDKDQLKNAPHHDPGQALSETEEAELFEHYGVPYGGDTVTEQTGGQDDLAGGQHERRDLAEEPGVQGCDTSRPTTDEAMTRSEEQLLVGNERVDASRARLRKYVVTENVKPGRRPARRGHRDGQSHRRDGRPLGALLQRPRPERRQLPCPGQRVQSQRSAAGGRRHHQRQDLLRRSRSRPHQHRLRQPARGPGGLEPADCWRPEYRRQRWRLDRW